MLKSVPCAPSGVTFTTVGQSVTVMCPLNTTARYVTVQVSHSWAQFVPMHASMQVTPRPLDFPKRLPRSCVVAYRSPPPPFWPRACVKHGHLRTVCDGLQMNGTNNLALQEVQALYDGG